MKLKMAILAKNGTQNWVLCPGYGPGTKIFGLRVDPLPIPSIPEKIIKIGDFDV